jgi:hypothetical protein
MTLTAPSGIKTIAFDIGDEIISLISMGFTDADIRNSDVAHITNTGVAGTAGNKILYTYNYDDIEDEVFVPFLPTDDDIIGHFLNYDSEIYVEGKRNLRNLRMIALTGTTRVTVTLCKYGV